jgi:hypothetical protein
MKYDFGLMNEDQIFEIQENNIRLEKRKPKRLDSKSANMLVVKALEVFEAESESSSWSHSSGHVEYFSENCTPKNIGKVPDVRLPDLDGLTPSKTVTFNHNEILENLDKILRMDDEDIDFNSKIIERLDLIPKRKTTANTTRLI